MGYRLSKHETRYSENVGVSSSLTTPMVGVVFEDGRQSVGHVAGKVNIEFNILYSIVLTGC